MVSTPPGLQIGQILKKTGISRGSIHYYLARAGIEPVGQVHSPPPHQHLLRHIYPPDTIERLMPVIQRARRKKKQNSVDGDLA